MRHHGCSTPAPPGSTAIRHPPEVAPQLSATFTDGAVGRHQATEPPGRILTGRGPSLLMAGVDVERRRRASPGAWAGCFCATSLIPPAWLQVAPQDG